MSEEADGIHYSKAAAIQALLQSRERQRQGEAWDATHPDSCLDLCGYFLGAFWDRESEESLAFKAYWKQKGENTSPAPSSPLQDVKGPEDSSSLLLTGGSSSCCFQNGAASEQKGLPPKKAKSTGGGRATLGRHPLGLPRLSAPLKTSASDPSEPKEEEEEERRKGGSTVLKYPGVPLRRASHWISLCLVPSETLSSPGDDTDGRDVMDGGGGGMVKKKQPPQQQPKGQGKMHGTEERGVEGGAGAPPRAPSLTNDFLSSSSVLDPESKSSSTPICREQTAMYSATRSPSRFSNKLRRHRSEGIGPTPCLPRQRRGALFQRTPTLILRPGLDVSDSKERTRRRERPHPSAWGAESTVLCTRRLAGTCGRRWAEVISLSLPSRPLTVSTTTTTRRKMGKLPAILADESGTMLVPYRTVLHCWHRTDVLVVTEDLIVDALLQTQHTIPRRTPPLPLPLPSSSSALQGSLPFPEDFPLGSLQCHGLGFPLEKDPRYLSLVVSSFSFTLYPFAIDPWDMFHTEEASDVTSVDKTSSDENVIRYHTASHDGATIDISRPFGEGMITRVMCGGMVIVECTSERGLYRFQERWRCMEEEARADATSTSISSWERNRWTIPSSSSQGSPGEVVESSDGDLYRILRRVGGTSLRNRLPAHYVPLDTSLLESLKKVEFGHGTKGDDDAEKKKNEWGGSETPKEKKEEKASKKKKKTATTTKSSTTKDDPAVGRDLLPLPHPPPPHLGDATQRDQASVWLREDELLGCLQAWAAEIRETPNLAAPISMYLQRNTGIASLLDFLEVEPSCSVPPPLGPATLDEAKRNKLNKCKRCAGLSSHVEPNGHLLCCSSSYPSLACHDSVYKPTMPIDSYLPRNTFAFLRPFLPKKVTPIAPKGLPLMVPPTLQKCDSWSSSFSGFLSTASTMSCQSPREHTILRREGKHHRAAGKGSGPGPTSAPCTPPPGPTTTDPMATSSGGARILSLPNTLKQRRELDAAAETLRDLKQMEVYLIAEQEIWRKTFVFLGFCFLPLTPCPSLFGTLLELDEALFHPEELYGGADGRWHLYTPDWFSWLFAVWSHPCCAFTGVSIEFPFRTQDVPKLGMMAGLLHMGYAGRTMSQVKLNLASLERKRVMALRFDVKDCEEGLWDLFKIRKDRETEVWELRMLLRPSFCFFFCTSSLTAPSEEGNKEEAVCGAYTSKEGCEYFRKDLESCVGLACLLEGNLGGRRDTSSSSRRGRARRGRREVPAGAAAFIAAFFQKTSSDITRWMPYRVFSPLPWISTVGPPYFCTPSQACDLLHVFFAALAEHHHCRLYEGGGDGGGGSTIATLTQAALLPHSPPRTRPWLWVQLITRPSVLDACRTLPRFKDHAQLVHYFPLMRFWPSMFTPFARTPTWCGSSSSSSSPAEMAHHHHHHPSAERDGGRRNGGGGGGCCGASATRVRAPPAAEPFLLRDILCHPPEWKPDLKGEGPRPARIPPPPPSLTTATTPFPRPRGNVGDVLARVQEGGGRGRGASYPDPALEMVKWRAAWSTQFDAWSSWTWKVPSKPSPVSSFDELPEPRIQGTPPGEEAVSSPYQREGFDRYPFFMIQYCACSAIHTAAVVPRPGEEVSSPRKRPKTTCRHADHQQQDTITRPLRSGLAREVEEYEELTSLEGQLSMPGDDTTTEDEAHRGVDERVYAPFNYYHNHPHYALLTPAQEERRNGIASLTTSFRDGGMGLLENAEQQHLPPMPYFPPPAFPEDEEDQVEEGHTPHLHGKAGEDPPERGRRGQKGAMAVETEDLRKGILPIPPSLSYHSIGPCMEPHQPGGDGVHGSFRQSSLSSPQGKGAQKEEVDASLPKTTATPADPAHRHFGSWFPDCTTIIQNEVGELIDEKLRDSIIKRLKDSVEEYNAREATFKIILEVC